MFNRHRSENRYYREWNAKNKMSVVKESTSNAADSGSISGLGSSPGEGNGTLSSILAWEIHGQRSLVGYSPGGHKTVGHDLATKPSTLLYIYYTYILAIAIGFSHL